MKKLMLVSLLALAPTAWAAIPPGITVQPLFSVTNDRDANVDKFGMMVNAQGVPVGVSYSPPGQQNGFSFADMNRGDGVTLIEGQGRKVLLLAGALGANFEGKLEFAYLSNGISGKYKTCDIVIRRSGNGFVAVNAYTNKQVTSAKIITHSLGLKTLQGICPAE